MKDAAGVLRDAMKLIERGGHAQRTNALDVNGRDVVPHTGHGAVRWSVTGAILDASRSAEAQAFIAALAAFGQAIGITDIPLRPNADWGELPVLTRAMCERIWQWEDHPLRTTKHVLYAFRLALEPEEEAA